MLSFLFEEIDRQLMSSLDNIKVIVDVGELEDLLIWELIERSLN